MIPCDTSGSYHLIETQSLRIVCGIITTANGVVYQWKKYQIWNYHKNASTALKLSQKIIKPLHSNEICSKLVTVNVKTTVCIDIHSVISLSSKELTSFNKLQLICLSQATGRYLLVFLFSCTQVTSPHHLKRT